jgi:hypothetical protein
LILGHYLPKRSIEIFTKIFDGTWGSGGPLVVTNVLKELCNFKKEEKFFDAKVHTKERCQGVQVYFCCHVVNRPGLSV